MNPLDHIVPNLQALLEMEYYVASTGFTLFPSRPVFALLTGKHESPQRGRGLDFEEVRKYVAGDDIRNIDWKVTARTQVTHSKVFNEEKEKPALLVVDLSSSMFFGSKEYTKLYIASQITALSAFFVLKRGDRVGGMVFTDSSYNFVKPQRSRKSVLHLFELLIKNASAVSKGEEWSKEGADFETVISKTAQMAYHDYQVIIVSDFLNMSEKSVKEIMRIRQHNNVMLIKIRDPLEEQLPDGNLLLSDGKLQIRWNNNRKASQERLKKALQDNDNLLEKLKKYSIPVVSLDTLTPVEEQIKVIFSQKNSV